jgi:hypothetical protein
MIDKILVSLRSQLLRSTVVHGVALWSMIDMGLWEAAGPCCNGIFALKRSDTESILGWIGTEQGMFSNGWRRAGLIISVLARYETGDILTIQSFQDSISRQGQ